MHDILGGEDVRGGKSKECGCRERDEVLRSIEIGVMAMCDGRERVGE